MSFGKSAIEEPFHAVDCQLELMIGRHWKAVESYIINLSFECTSCKPMCGREDYIWTDLA